MPTVSELAALVGGEVFSGSGDAVIEGPAALESAGSGEISFFAHPRYAADLRTTRAAAVLVPRDFSGETPAVCIRVDDPSAAFTRIIQPMLDRIHANLHQSRTLATLRDTLLPKLLSGELSVNAALESAS